MEIFSLINRSKIYNIYVYIYILLIAKYIYKIKIQIVQFVPIYLQLKDCSSKLSVPMYIVILLKLLYIIYNIYNYMFIYIYI